MKHDCDIVRDLMPMCIDGTASEKAKQMVDEHVAECLPCDKVYTEMKGEAKLELPVQPAAPEFVTTVKKMKNRRKRRTWLALLLGVMIAAVLAWCGCFAYYWYFMELVPVEDAQLTLVMTSDGLGLIHAANVPKSTVMDIAYDAMAYPEAAKGQYAGYVHLKATRYEVRTAAADVYFVIGNMTADRLMVGNDWGQDSPVYRMQLSRTDGSGQVFYQYGEDELKYVSLKGVHLKSAGRSYERSGASQHLVSFATVTPMPTYTPDLDGSQVFVMASPTPTPRQTVTSD